MLSNTDEQLLIEFLFVEGYFDTDILAAPGGSMVRGSKNLFVTDQGSLRVFRGVKDTGLTGGRTMFVVANGFAALKDIGSTQGVGSIFNYISESLFWIGEGTVLMNGLNLVDSVSSANFVATSSLQLSPKKSGTTTYTRAYIAGLQVPSTLTAVVPRGTGLLEGLYSFKIAQARSVTGARSVASATSAVVSFAKQKARLTFPLISTNGANRWAIFATKAGFGGTGVHYLVKEINETDLTSIDGIARSYEIDFADSDLLPVTAYIDDYPPPAGAFAARLENYVVVVGAYENAIACSIRNFPESFNPEHLAFLPKKPTAVLPDQQGNYLYISTESGVYALAIAPSAFDNPMMLQTVWSDTGVASPHNWCAYEGVIFAFVSRQGAVTMDALGKPSSEFALPVARGMRNWTTTNTKVFACPDLKSVIYTNGGEAYAFNVTNLKWSAPAKVSEFGTGEIISGVIQNRRLKITLLSGTTFKLYDFDEQPTGGSAGYVARSPDVVLSSGGRGNILGLKGKFFASEAGVTTLNVFCDFAATPTKTFGHTSPATGMQVTGRTRWYLPRKEAVSVSIEGTQSDFTKDCYPSRLALFGTEEESNNFAGISASVPPPPPPPVTPAPVASFTKSPAGGAPPLAVAFTDTSTGSPTSWSWNFGDATALSTVQSPSHTYTAEGTFTVTLTVTNLNGSSSTSQSITVTSSAIYLVDPDVFRFTDPDGSFLIDLV